MITIWFHTIRALGKAHRCYIAAKSRTRAAQVLTCGRLSTETLKTCPSTPAGEGWAPAWITDEGVWVERACIPGESWDAWKAHLQTCAESACEKVQDVSAAVYRLGDLHASALEGSPASPAAVSEVALISIEAEASAQARVALDDAALEEYAEAMRAGATFPPVVLFFDGVTYWLADGFHRLEAARQARRASLPADVRPGGLREAQLYAIGANATHGLRRTNADKRRAVELMLRDPEWAQWSDRAIAKHCDVSHPLVALVRKALAGKITTPPAPPKSEEPAPAEPQAQGEAAEPIAPPEEIGRQAADPESDQEPEGDDAPWEEDPEPAEDAPADPAETAGMRQQVAELQAQVAELQQLLRDGQADAEAVARILEADDRTAQALEEIKRAHALARATDEQLRQVQGRAAFLGQEAEKWKRLAEKAQERKEKRQGSPKPTTPEQAAGMVPAGPAWD